MNRTDKVFRPALMALAFVLLGLALTPALGAEVRHDVRFPDLPGYRTLACDFHMHTVFSDGQVWPPVRVVEAWRQGLDAISITDHIEYQPHKDDVPTSHNRPYELAAGPARTHNLLLIKAAEITRDTPPGHFNALFLEDAGRLDTKDFLEAIQRANQQGAFVIWNHQAWKGAEKGQWLQVHTTIYAKKWLHGMEVCNGGSYYPDAHRWCLEKNLTMIGGSDLHEPDARNKSTSADHRTLTLVFAKQATAAALKEALMAGRTAVWFEDRIIGRREFLGPLLDKCVRVSPPHLRSEKSIWVQIHNDCDADVRLQRLSGLGPAELELPAGTTSLVRINIAKPAEPLKLKYTAANFLIAPDTGLPVVLEIPER